MSEHTFYRWRKRYGRIKTEGVAKMRELKRGNSEYKRILADRVLEVETMKKLIQKNGWRS